MFKKRDSNTLAYHFRAAVLLIEQRIAVIVILFSELNWLIWHKIRRLKSGDEKDVKELTCPRKYTNNGYPFLGIMGGFHWSYCSVRHFAIYVCRQECFYRASVPAIKRFLGASRRWASPLGQPWKRIRGGKASATFTTNAMRWWYESCCLSPRSNFRVYLS